MLSVVEMISVQSTDDRSRRRGPYPEIVIHPARHPFVQTADAGPQAMAERGAASPELLRGSPPLSEA
jgi:hypothetical protein